MHLSCNQKWFTTRTLGYVFLSAKRKKCLKYFCVWWPCLHYATEDNRWETSRKNYEKLKNFACQRQPLKEQMENWCRCQVEMMFFLAILTDIMHRWYLVKGISSPV